MRTRLLTRWCATVLCAVLTASMAHTTAADPVIFDDFDDGALGGEWEIVLQDALGWTYTEAGTELTVTEIEPGVINPGGGGTWATVTLTRTCPTLKDFRANFDISWDCLDSDAAMQRLWLSLLDASGEPVARAGFSDPWIGSRACRMAVIGEQSRCEFDDLPHAGTAAVEIARVDDVVSVLWDGVSLLSDVDIAPIARVEIQFAYYGRQGPPDSIFGSESVDRVSLEGVQVGLEQCSWAAIKTRFP